MPSRSTVSSNVVGERTGLNTAASAALRAGATLLSTGQTYTRPAGHGAHCPQAQERDRADRGQDAGTARCRWSPAPGARCRRRRRSGRPTRRGSSARTRRACSMPSSSARRRASRSRATTASRSPASRARSPRPATTGVCGHGSSAMTTAAPPSPRSAGASRPRRSLARPTIGLVIASSAERAQEHRPDRRGRRAELLSRSGASTPIVPNSSPGMVISHIDVTTVPSRIRPSRSRTEPARARRRRRRARRPGHQPEAEDADRREHRLRPERVGERAEHGPEQRAGDRGAHGRADQLARGSRAAPRRSASPSRRPTTRRRRAPARSARGPARRCSCANANPRLATDIRPRPVSTVGRTPSRAASQPPGSAAGERPRRVGGGEHAGLALGQRRTRARQVGSSGVIAR